MKTRYVTHSFLNYNILEVHHFTNTKTSIFTDKYRYYNLSNRNCEEEAFHIMDGLGAEITVDDCKWWCSNNNTCKFIFISHSPLKRCEFKTDACRNITVNRLGSGEFHTKFGS